MPTTTTPTAVAVFDTREQAAAAVDALRAAGFGDEQIGVGARPADPGNEGVSGQTTWETGAGIGGLAGASLGGMAAGPPGMVGGGLVGLLIGTLIDLGIPEQEARWYSGEADAGRVVVTVRANERVAEARAILQSHGGREVESPTS
jgi:hypothetical protein